ncbi:MAG: ComEC/Rec2 family competence protein [Treponema sp.]|nr:ComEC/Rec2 family competence protein [Treponema sp.]
MVRQKYTNKSIFIAVLICIVILYSKIVPLRNRNPYCSIVPFEKISGITGELLSSPVKSSGGKTYSASFRIIEIISDNAIVSTGKGIITIFVPAVMIEAFYPGKLYSPAKEKGALLWEKGGIYKIKGHSIQQNFLVESVFQGFFPQSLSGKICFFRALCRLQFKRLMFSWGKAGGLLLALLCGSREYTEESIIGSFKNAGLSHILALSGMHLSMFSGLAMFFGKKIGRKKITFCIRVTVLIIFVWFAGFSPSLLRAFICSMLLLIATLANVKQPDTLLILCFSFILQIILSPFDLYNMGFILSYSALAGILLFNDFFRKVLSCFLPNYFSASLGASISAQTFTIPFSLKSFGSYSPIGIIATTFVSPAITIFIYSGLFLILLSLIFPVLASPSGIFINFLYTIIKYMVAFFAKCPCIKI